MKRQEHAGRGKEEEGKQEQEEEEEEEEEDIIFLLDDVKHIISCLYNLSITMRQPVPLDRLQKYAKIDLSHYTLFDRQHARERFPSSPEYLVTRLGDANTKRRQYFQYQLSHHKKIARHIDERAQNVTLGNDAYHHKSIVSSADPTQQLERVPAPQDPIACSVTNAAPLLATISIIPQDTATLGKAATLDDAEIQSEGGQTATSYGTAAEPKEYIPLHEKSVFNGNAFQCPYCYSLIRVQSERAWR